MIKYIEQFAENIVEYLYNPRKNKSKKKNNQKKIKNKIIKVKDYIYYEIIPYHMNNFDNKTFEKFLKSFSFSSKRINFYIYGNNSQAHLFVSVPSRIKNIFVNTFYNFFPSSKIVETDLSISEPDEYLYTIDDPIKIRENKKFFSEMFFLFKDISLKNNAFVKYSLILNSSGDIQYESLTEIIRNFFKLVLWGIYYFVYQVFLGKAPEKKIIKKKQQIETGIKGTAISIGIGGPNEFKKIFFNYLNDNSEFNLNKQKLEIFSSTKIHYFSNIFHIPTKTENIPLIPKINYKKLPPPSNLPIIDNNTTVLGNADWADEKIKIGLKQEDKARHVYIVGKTGVGKSTLLSNMIFSDLEHGKGLALIDPHGDLVETILKIVPEDRIDDIVLFDVSDTQNIVGFNPFFKISNSPIEEKEKNKDLLVSTILSIFKKLYSYSWGPRLEYILRNVLITLVDYPEANFLDIVRILTDKNFRKKVITDISDPIMKNFWEKEFSKRSERFASEAISPILNKIGQFTASGIVRNIFGQKESTLDISEIMNSNKILLVNLSKGLIGEDNSELIGSFIVSQIQIETMKRAKLQMKDRTPFTLYIDEFQNFATESFAVILSESRKYNLSLVVANQYITQITNEIKNAIFGNVGNLIAFNSGNEDAEILSKQFKNKVTVEDIISIPRFKAYLKIMIDGTSSDVFGLSTQPIPDNIQQSEKFVRKIKDLSNKKYTKPKNEIEKQINTVFINELNIQEKSQDTNKNNKNETKKHNNHIITNSNENNIFKGTVKIKFNYGLFVVTDKYEGLLHKKNIHLPEGINWKDYYNVGDKINVKLIQLKEVDGQIKAIWETV